MKLTDKAIRYCKDPLQHNVIKLWSQKDPDLAKEKIMTIVKYNPYLALSCAEGMRDEFDSIVLEINSYIDSKLNGKITSKRQFTQMAIVKLTLGYYDQCKDILINQGRRLIDTYSISEVILSLASHEEALVVFFSILMKTHPSYVDSFLSLMEDFDLFFIRTDKNKEFFDTAVGYTMQKTDFRSLRLFYGNQKVLEQLFAIHKDYCGWSQASLTCEEFFFEHALKHPTKSSLYLMAEYITDKLNIQNPLSYRIIPDNTDASSEDYLCVKKLFNRYMDEHGYSIPEAETLNSHSYYSIHVAYQINSYFKRISTPIHPSKTKQTNGITYYVCDTCSKEFRAASECPHCGQKYFY